MKHENWIVRIPDKELGTLLLIADYVRPYGWSADWLNAMRCDNYDIIYFEGEFPILSKKWIEDKDLRISNLNEITWRQFCTDILNIKPEYELY